MLAYIPYMDPIKYDMEFSCNCSRKNQSIECQPTVSVVAYGAYHLKEGTCKKEMSLIKAAKP